MGYLKIENLYRLPQVFECYTLEKIDGCSSWITYSHDGLDFHGGCMSDEGFKQFINTNFPALELSLASKFLHAENVTLYGELYGGKIQGMSKYYGKDTRFTVFDVKIGDKWLNVPNAEEITQEVGLQFVPYERGPLTLEWLNQQRDSPSKLCVGEDNIKEGIVVRPIYEMSFNNGGRWIFKHKRDEFRETKTPREVDPNKMLVLTTANAVADEWVTPMRLQHVLQKTPYNGVQDTGKVIIAMVEDVKLESAGEFEWSREIAREVSKNTVKLLQNINAGDNKNE